MKAIRRNVTWRRIIVLAVAVVASVFVASFSVATALVRPQPFLAEKLAPYLSGPKARLAVIHLAMSIESGDAAKAKRYALAAANRDPFEARAIGVLGYVERARKNDKSANSIFAYSHAISRHDIATNLDRITEAAKRGDTADAIHEFDISLRTSRSSWDAYFPIIYRIGGDAKATAALAKVLSANPQWKWPFLDGYARNADDPRNPASLLDALEKFGPVQNDDLQKTVIARLVEVGSYAEATERFAKFASDKGFQDPQNGAFENPVSNLPLEWEVLVENTFETGVSENVTRKSFGKSFYFRVPTDRQGELLRLTTTLKPGRHELRFVLGPPLEGEPGKLALAIDCLGGQADITGSSLLAPSPGKKLMSFTVPPQCAAVRLYLNASSVGSSESKSDAWVTWLDNLET